MDKSYRQTIFRVQSLNDYKKTLTISENLCVLGEEVGTGEIPLTSLGSLSTSVAMEPVGRGRL